MIATPRPHPDGWPGPPSAGGPVGLAILGMACRAGRFRDLDELERAVLADTGTAVPGPEPSDGEVTPGVGQEDLLLAVAEEALRDTVRCQPEADADAGRDTAIVLAADTPPVAVAERISAWGGPEHPAVCLANAEEDVASLLRRARHQLDTTSASTVLVGVADGAGAVALVLAAADGSGGRRIYATIDAVVSRPPGDPAVRADQSTVDTVAAVAGPRTVRRSAREVLTAAGTGPDGVDYVELFSVAAPDAGQAELARLAGLADVWSAAAVGSFRTALGALGSTVAVSGATAGLLGVVKAALCLHTAHIPATPEWSGPNPEALSTWDRSAFYVPTTSRPWYRSSPHARRRAAVVGTSHTASLVLLVMSGATTRGAVTSVDWARAGGHLVVPVAAANPDALLERVADARAALAAGGSVDDLVRAGIGQLDGQDCRAVFCAPDVAGLVRELDLARRNLRVSHAEGREWTTPAGSCSPARPLGPAAGVAFVFPGMLGAHLGLGGDLFRAFPGLARCPEAGMDQQSEVLGGERLHPRTVHPPGTADLARMEDELLADAPALLVTGTAFAGLHARLLRMLLGDRPHGAFGYSLGELTMLHATEAWHLSTRDAVRLGAAGLFRDGLFGPRRVVREAWGLGDDVPTESVWGMRSLFVDADAVRARLPEYDRVFLTHVNTPREVVVAGDPAQCEALARALDCPSIRSAQSPVLHCPLVPRSELLDLCRRPCRPPGGAELFSARDYGVVTDFDPERVAAGLTDVLRNTLDFPRLVRAVYDRGYRYFLEAGPGTSVTRWIREILGDEPHVAESVDRRGASTSATVARLVARLVGHGLPVDLDALTPPRSSSLVSGRTRVEVGQSTKDVSQSTEDGPGSAVCPPHAERTPGERTAVTFSGEPAGLVPYQAAGKPIGDTASRVSAPRPEPTSVGSSAIPGARSPAELLRLLHDQTLSAHRAVMSAQQDLQERVLTLLRRAPHDRARPAGSLTEAPARPDHAPVVLDEAAVLEFATGRLANVFGAAFAPVDEYPRRVRLPAPPYLFVSRITAIEGETGHLGPAFVRSEYDVPDDAWFAVDGAVPLSVVVEGVQANMVLVSRLGVDFENRGERVYRMLDHTGAFTGTARVGQRLRYDIDIERFVHTAGGPTVFFFRARCFADERPIGEITNACAGFFSDAELAAAPGVLPVRRPRRPRRSRRTAAGRRSFRRLLRPVRTRLGTAEIDELAAGRVAEVFGPAYGQRAACPGPRLVAGRLRMLDEVTDLSPTGGRSGLGTASGITRLRPDGWYFAGHLPDDPLLPGSLLAEGAMELLQVCAFSLGMHLCLPNAEFAPVPDVACSASMRRQVTPECRELRYEAEITDIGLLPDPRVVADVLVYAGDTAVAVFRDLALRLVTRDPRTDAPDQESATGDNPDPLLAEFHVEHLALGDHATALGPEFGIYAGRGVPRLPHGDLRFVDRVLSCTGRRGECAPGVEMVSECDLPADLWCLADHGGPWPPNLLLLELALQPAIVLGHHLGATLSYPDQDFRVRNLDGTATLLRPVDLRDRTVRQRVVLLSHDAVNGAVLQRFRFELAVDGETFHSGESVLGFLTDPVLARGAGLDPGDPAPPWWERHRPSPAEVRSVDLAALRARSAGPLLPGGRLDLVDALDVVPGGGDHGGGYLCGWRRIRPDDWFFACHFRDDPVMPGSLGLEAVLTGLRAHLLDSGLVDDIPDPAFTVAPGVATRWKYRGQILPSDEEMTFDVHLGEVRRAGGRLVVTAEANVWKPGQRVYRVDGIAVEVRPGEEASCA
ncbi:hypothetical protein [Streptoalloteichus hindustanus]|uniref:PfaB family protein n=1 Tax=Streptoalloteichus hindustanus TaxID=2017 RepID=A0A1M4YR26_STRHI|nr:hypothetical protein [Streptoalloteichus hindustanus]SHF07962.1 PfaB family protein [Streptoalloteichus hindustanus]